MDYMVKRAVRRELSEIDPMFFIPDGVDELVYENEFELEDDEIGDDDEDYEEDDGDGPEPDKDRDNPEKKKRKKRKRKGGGGRRGDGKKDPGGKKGGGRAGGGGKGTGGGGKKRGEGKKKRSGKAGKNKRKRPVVTNHSYAPDTPQILGIATEKIRMDESGAEVVDVVLTVEEVGSAKYEFRVTKT